MRYVLLISSASASIVVNLEEGRDELMSDSVCCSSKLHIFPPILEYCCCGQGYRRFRTTDFLSWRTNPEAGVGG